MSASVRGAVDVVVVGGGPAGLATAIRARMAGLDVRVIERRARPVDKACGEGLMPGAVAALQRLGVEVPEAERFAFRGIRYVDGDMIAEARFAGPPGWGVRRTVLHRSLARRAEDLGALLSWETSCTGVDGAGVRTDRGTIASRWIVAADGLRSPLRRAAGLDGSPAPRRRFGVRRHYRVEPWTDLVEVHWSDGCEAYVTPVGPQLVGVALLFGGTRERWDRMRARFPALDRRLRGAPVVSRERGAGPLEQRARAVVRGNLALVGDAAGYVDAISGEGLAVTFRQAEAVVDAMVRGDLRRYGRAHRRIMTGPNRVTRLLLAVERRPRLRRFLIRALAAHPRWFVHILNRERQS